MTGKNRRETREKCLSRRRVLSRRRGRVSAKGFLPWSPNGLLRKILAGHAHLHWPAEGLSSTGAPGQPVPHRPLTRHGATLFNLVHSALPVPSCRLFQQVAGLPSLASWGSMRVFLAAAAATADAAGLNILSTSTSTDLQLPMDSSMQASMPGHAPKCRSTRARTSGERIPSSSSR